ncbi:MAG: MFS transporter [Desulfosudaceae bacterium]
MKDRSSGVFYYGWYIVALAFVANFLSVGTGFYAFNAFMEPLCQANQWTRTQVNVALMIGTPFGFVAQFIFGTLLMRFGVKQLMVAGSLLGGVAFILLFRTSSLGLFYFLYILLFVGNGAYGGIVANSAVSNWFVNRRGRALGVATAGISFSGAVLPFMAMVMIQNLGMKNAAAGIGGLVLAFAPLVWLVVVNWPEDIGLLPDGETEPGAAFETVPISPVSPDMVLDEGAAAEETAWPLSRLAREPAFWKLGLAYAMVMMGVVGVMSQLKPRFVDVGFSDTMAMTLMALTALFGAAGKYSWGMLCDRVDSLKVAAIIMIANGIGLAAALLANSPAAIMVFVGVFGFAMGGVMATYPIVVADLFGRRAFSSVFRFMAVFLIIQMAGFIMAGLSFDLTGSYDVAYGLFIALDLSAAVIILSVKRPAGSWQRISPGPRNK